MTISSTASRIAYSGNGTVTTFSFPYEFDDTSELVVIERTTADGTESVKTLATHYTVSGALASAGGTVTMLSAPAATKKLIIYRKPPFTQGLDLEYNGAIPPLTLEQTLDKNVKLLQYLQDQVSRCVHLTQGEPGVFDPTLPAVMTPDYYLVVNGAGTGWTLAAGGGGGGGGSGSVTSVSMTVPSFLSVPGTAITTSGTFAVTLSTQIANKIFAGPTTGSDATPTFRSLVAADLPTLTVSRALVTSAAGVFTVSAVTSTELGYVSGVTSALQTQMDLKAPKDQPSFTTNATFSYATATTVPYFDSSKVLVSSSVTPTELGYLSGVTSGLQAQFTAKLTASGGTVTAGVFATSAVHSYATLSTVPYFDASKNLVSSAVTPTELGYVSGLTSAAQTQLTSLKIDEYIGFIPAAENKTYTIDESPAFGYTVNTLITKLVSGTCTIAANVGGTVTTGISAHAATSSQVASTATASNVGTAGQRVSLILTNCAAPVDLAFTIKYTRS